VPRDIKGAVSVLAEGYTGLQDVVRVSVLDSVSHEPESFSYMANVGGVGLDARVCEIVNRKKVQGLRGKHLYVTALLYCIRHRVPVSARILCDGKEVFSGQYLSIAFGVGRYSGGGMQQTPLAELGDGLLDVTVIPDIPLWTIAKEIPKLFNGKFHTVDVLTLAKCREVIVLPEAQADMEPVEVDGEVIGRAPVKMGVMDNQINVVMKGPHR
jgi:diacylglycerol kinase family enzyme